jgi:hypothetical protein
MPLNKMILPAALIIGAFLLAGLLLIVLQPAPHTSGAERMSADLPPPPASRSSAEPEGFTGAWEADAGAVVAPAGRQSEDAAIDESEVLEPVESSWEAPINAILESTEENDAVAMRLSALAPTLPLDGRVEATQHMVNLLGDENYQPALQKLVSLATPPEVMEVIYSDVLNRPNTVKLPVLVNVLGVPSHPLRAEALDTLQIFVGRDLGNDTQAWSAAVQEFLRAEALENAVPSDQ